MATLSLLHISDLHFFDPKQPFNALFPDIFQGHRHDARLALCDFARSRGDQFHAILVTGDLAETGTKEHLRFAHDVLFPTHSPQQAIPSIGPPYSDFRAVAKDIHILPGNHDRFHEPLRFPGNDDFHSVFGSHWPLGLGKAKAAVFPIPNSNNRVAVISADFCLHDVADANPWIFYFGQGTAAHHTTTLYTNALDNLKNHTEKVQQDAIADGVACAVLWAIHFPPVALIPPGLLLNRYQRILQLANQLSVKLILSGHLHASLPFYATNGGPTIWTAGTATAKWGALNTLHILDIDVDDRSRWVEVSRRNFVLDSNTWQFSEIQAFAGGNTIPGVSWQL